VRRGGPPAGRRRLAAILLVAAVLAVGGCAGDTTGATPTPDPTRARAIACAGAAESVGASVQRYVDAFAEPLATPAAASAPSASAPALGAEATSTATPDEDLQTAVAGARQVVADEGCDPQGFTRDVEAALGDVTAQGPVARAVLRQLRASLTGRADQSPRTREVAPGDDLPEVLAEVAAGSTVLLAAGTYRLAEPLVLLRGVTLRGSGRDTTTLDSSAADSGVLVLTADRVELSDLAVSRDGSTPGSVVVAGSSASLVTAAARLQGGSTSADGLGGAGILMASADLGVPTTRTTLEVTDTELVGNAGAGIALSGDHRASILGSRFSGSGQCGVCFLDASSGSVETSTFDSNAVGVAVLGAATPTILGVTIAGGEVGIQLAGTATATIDGARISGAARAAILYGASSAGSLAGTTCTDVPFGIVVGPQATPTLGDNACALTQSAQ
jgi:hypothetical protein